MKKWLDDYSLDQAAYKNEAFFPPRIHKTTFNDIHSMDLHMEKEVAKAKVATVSLGRLMANTGYPRATMRRLLITAMQYIFLCGAEIWGDTLQTEVQKKARMVNGYERRYAADQVRTKEAKRRRIMQLRREIWNAGLEALDHETHGEARSMG